MVAGKPDQSIGSARPEDDFECLAEAALVIGGRQQREVIHHPRVAVAMPVVLVGRWGRRLRVNQSVGGKVVEQALAVEVEVAHVAVERGRFLAARRRLAEDDGVNVQREVFTRQLSYKHNTTQTISRGL